jgi:hypothetical protein
MFGWLQGPGDNFRRPLGNSTNYLTAYDARGTLLRGRKENEPPQASTTDPAEPDTEAARQLEAAAEEVGEVNRETEDDLRPFPLNKHFVSQSILSEELQEEIWKRVQAQGKSVRQVSVEMGVDMRRVAAVVRLVEVEKRMKAEASHPQPFSPFDDEQPKSISLPDFQTW